MVENSQRLRAIELFKGWTQSLQVALLHVSVDWKTSLLEIFNFAVAVGNSDRSHDAIFHDVEPEMRIYEPIEFLDVNHFLRIPNVIVISMETVYMINSRLNCNLWIKTKLIDFQVIRIFP